MRSLKKRYLGFNDRISEYINRIDYLRKTPAKVKFLSLEPLLTPIKSMNLNSIDWVIVGGESGPGARLIEKEWVTDIYEQCQKKSIPFFFKQWGGTNKKKTGKLLNGKIYCEMPERKILFQSA